MGTNQTSTKWSVDTNSFNFMLGCGCTDRDRDSFFQATGDEQVVELKHDCLDLADIVVIAGVFQSRTQAVKNGFVGPIKNGFTMLTVGKKRTLIAILKIL